MTDGFGPGCQELLPRLAPRLHGSHQAVEAEQLDSPVDDAGEVGACGPGSLQQAFLKWSWRVSEQLQPRNGRQEKGDPPCSTMQLVLRKPRDSAQKQVLRNMFVNLARGYIGVPYAKRHHQPPSCPCEGCTSSQRQLALEPLFLDCCGLVRKVARRMQRQLGFQLGPGNQAYQFDTLPVRVGSVAELEPGDLIFYSGACFDPGAKRQPFDMMHVEIFTGGRSGEATIGSRERYKWVMEYDSFIFQSQRWSLIAHHFCKLDTWLDGVCRPQHPELWLPAAPAPPPPPPAHTQAAAGAAATAAGGGVAPAQDTGWDGRQQARDAGDDEQRAQGNEQQAQGVGHRRAT